MRFMGTYLYKFHFMKGENIMNEENKNLEVIEDEEVEVTEMEPETSGNGVLGKLALGAAIVAAGSVILLRKTKAKREEFKIRQLEKKGYIITRPDEVEDAEVVSGDDDAE